MKLKFIFTFTSFIILIIFALVRCTENAITAEAVNDELLRPILFISGTNNLGDINTDEVSIDNVIINKNILTISATYPGGCDIHSTALFSKTGWNETSPVQLEMKLIHHSYSDTCSNNISERFYFDLKPLATLYYLSYRTKDGVIQLHIYDSDTTNISMHEVLYEF